MSRPSDNAKYLKDATPAHKVGAFAWIARAGSARTWLPALVLGMASVGCAAEVPGQEVQTRVSASTSDTTIFGGAKDDDGESLAGVVALRVGKGTTFELCTGALIAPNVVLTARHCVTKNVTTSVACDENGRSANGEHVAEEEDPSSIGVYVGATPSFGRAPLTTGRAIVSPTGPYLCDSDIAIVVLESPITEIEPLPVRIHSPARKGEMIRAIGYGQNDASSPIGTRFRKNSVSVLAQGKAVSPSRTPLGAHEFEVGKSICQGDSGGPAISEETGAVIGVVSRGGGCDDDFGHIYTTTSGFDDMFADAFALAAAAPTPEPGDAASAGGATTRSRSAQANDGAEEQAAASAAGCAVAGTSGPLAGRGAGGTGLVVVAAALAAIGARRRRAFRA